MRSKTSTGKRLQGQANTLSFKSVFEADDELEQFGSNSLSMFALSLYLRLDDLGEFAANSIVEGPNDKKLDIFYLSIADGLAVMVQSYLSPDWNRIAARESKASDLNTAMAWLLSADQREVPPHLKSKAIDLRRAIVSGEINRIELLFIHNCPESKNVERELKVVATATKSKVAALDFDASRRITIAHRELGLKGIEDLYKSRDSEILVDRLITLPAKTHIQQKGTGWRSILVTVPGHWLQGLYSAHGDRLFSANYRDFLGSTSRKGNINYAITKTTESEPDNFWVYNNGVTALTHKIRLGKTKRIRGISIINGAQTTGSLSEAQREKTKRVSVMLRIVECSDKKLIDKIIRYNNTQNDIKPADKRSKDQIQKRLQEDFGALGITYAHRRSSVRTRRGTITAASLGPALCAFHGDPQTAYRNAKEIFDVDDVYDRVFPRGISAAHVFLVRALSSAIDSVKAGLKSRISDGAATNTDLEQYEVLKFSASKHFLFYLIGELADQIMNRHVADKYDWVCTKDVIKADNTSLIKAWGETLGAILPHVSMLIKAKGADAFYDVPRSKEMSRDIATQTKALIASLPVLSSQFQSLRDRSSI